MNLGRISSVLAATASEGVWGEGREAREGVFLKSLPYCVSPSGEWSWAKVQGVGAEGVELMPLVTGDK